MKTFELGRCYGLRLTVKPSVVWGTLAVWAVWSLVGVSVFGVPALAAIWVGLPAILLHWASEFVHQLGHAWAARRVGHPMIGIRFWGPLSSSIYPRDEGDLFAGIHIRRALGGPFFSLIMTLFAGGLLLALAPASPAGRWLLLFFFLENLFVFTLQMFVPLGFNDGGTLWRWLRQPRAL